jgi:hypothetical protein
MRIVIRTAKKGDHREMLGEFLTPSLRGAPISEDAHHGRITDDVLLPPSRRAERRSNDNNFCRDAGRSAAMAGYGTLPDRRQ